MSEWQPIETAPKDGRYLLLTDIDTIDYEEEPPMVVGLWLDEKYTCDGYSGWYYAYWDSGWRSCYCPTHWMPLPKPPEGR